MASVYCYSGAAGSGTGADWANAITTLASALNSAGVGGTVYVADDHTETQASAMTVSSPGTAASPTRVLCVLRSGGSVPPVSADLRTTATVSTTGANSISFTGFAHCEGVTFQAGDGASAASLNFTSPFAWDWILKNCCLELRGTSSSSRIAFGASSSAGMAARLIASSFKFADAGQGVTLAGITNWTWQDTASAIQGTTPTTLFLSAGTGRAFAANVSGVDLSALASGCSLVTASTPVPGNYQIQNCKLGSSVSVTTGSVAGSGCVSVRLVNCDSADTNYRYYRQTYQGTITHETVIVRTGGASDGTTPISRKMVTTANSKFFSPLESDPIAFWNETAGSSVTATVEVVTDGVTLTDAEAWLEVEYLGTSGFPIASFANDRSADILATGANQTSSSETWTTTGLSSPVKQKLSVTFTPQEKGVVRCKVCLAKASTTIWYCPKADVS